MIRPGHGGQSGYPEFIGGPFDGERGAVDDPKVWEDGAGHRQYLVRCGSRVTGLYLLDMTTDPPRWRWYRKEYSDV